jgi:hypothetical protein
VPPPGRDQHQGLGIRAGDTTLVYVTLMTVSSMTNEASWWRQSSEMKSAVFPNHGEHRAPFWGAYGEIAGARMLG